MGQCQPPIFYLHFNGIVPQIINNQPKVNLFQDKTQDTNPYYLLPNHLTESPSFRIAPLLSRTINSSSSLISSNLTLTQL